MKQLFTSLAITACLFVCLSHAASAQKAKFGNVSEQELQMKVYAGDTTAVAVILSDFGSTRFMFNDQIQLVTERHTRIKILKKAGYDWANVEVPYYKKGTQTEKVSSIKGVTYNLVSGKITKDKLESKGSFDEQRSENWFVKKFAMPNVKEGSVLDFSYTIVSDFPYNLKEWEFQTSIPTVWSEYQVFIPEYFDYKTLQQGFQKIYTPKELGLPYNVQNEGYKWIAKDVPALKEERFITTLNDYISKIEFELEQVKFPGESSRTMTGTWENETRKLLDHQYFGRQLNRSGFFKEQIAAVATSQNEPVKQMEAIYKLVQNHMKWNGKYGIWIDNTIKKAFEERKGNIADVNMLLVAMLQEAGMDAAPVIVSTRSHGKAYKGTPLLSEFNYVLAHVKVADKEYLLDATEPFLPAGLLPLRSLNGEGYLVKEKTVRWVPLKPVAPYGKSLLLDVTLAEDGSMKGKGSESAIGYRALGVREDVRESGLEKYLKDQGRESGGFVVNNHSITNLEDLSKDPVISYDITSAGNGDNNAVLYLNPLLGFGEKENPFKLTDRFYPVDFGMAHDVTIVGFYTLPAGWVMDEAPKPVRINLPNNGGTFTYMVQLNSNRLQVMSKFSLAKTVYGPEEYAALKEFYNLVVAKHAEQIVLKKQL